MWRVLVVVALAGCAGAGLDADGPEGLWKGGATGAFQDASGGMVTESYLLKFVVDAEGYVTVEFPGAGNGWVQEDRSVWVTSQAPGGRTCTYTGVDAGDDYATGPMVCTRLAGERSDLRGEWWAEREGPCAGDACA